MIQKFDVILLVGGQGNRLRPLTKNIPKSIIEFGNKLMIEHQIEQLVNQIQINRLILCLGFNANLIQEQLQYLREKYKIDIVCSIENEPLGTGGALRNCYEYIQTEQVFVLNSDIITIFDFNQMISIKNQFQYQIVILAVEVENPQRFGVLKIEKNNQILDFIEKPVEFISNLINAGCYVIDTKLIQQIPLEFNMLEKDLFVKVAKNGLLGYSKLNSFWKDIGQCQDYLIANQMYIKHLYQNQKLQSLYLLDESVEIKDNRILEYVSIHKNVKLANNIELKNSIIHSNVQIEDNVSIVNSVIGQNVIIQNNVTIINCFIAENVIINNGVTLNDQKIEPNNKILKD